MKTITVYLASLAIVLLVGLAIYFAPPQPTTHRQPAQPPVVMEVLDPSLEVYAPMWRDEIARRFDNAVGVLVHGGDFVAGSWIAGVSFVPGHVTPMREVVERTQKAHPGRTVVLLACNTGNVKLGIPGVYYSTSSTWCVPDRAITPDMYGLPIIKATLTPQDEDEASVIPFITIFAEPEPTRWELHPDYCGNVWEFVTD
jgi:hypothetical protein